MAANGMSIITALEGFAETSLEIQVKKQSQERVENIFGFYLIHLEQQWSLN